MLGQIIIVNGTSGSGKSTACELFSARAEGFWLTYGIDHFMGSTFPRKFGHRGARSQEGICAVPVDAADPEGALCWQMSPQGLAAFAAFHEWIAAASRQGCNIILDHLLMLDPPLLQDCIWRLKDLPVLLVNLKPPYEVLMERVANREVGQRFSNSNFSAEQIAQSKTLLGRLRPWFYEVVYANDCCDLLIDTAQHSPEAVCELIERRLEAGPGTAFESLRGRYPL
jgi:chloramphenicol 3-O-phosphotransferase